MLLVELQNTCKKNWAEKCLKDPTCAIFLKSWGYKDVATWLELEFFLSYSNSTRTKHYSDWVVSSMNTRYFWTIAHSMTLVLSVKYWEESFICSISSTILYSNFSFLSVLMYKTWGKFELFFTNWTNSDFLLLLDSNLTRSQKPLLAGNCILSTW